MSHEPVARVDHGGSPHRRGRTATLDASAATPREPRGQILGGASGHANAIRSPDRLSCSRSRSRSRETGHLFAHLAPALPQFRERVQSERRAIGERALRALRSSVVSDDFPASGRDEHFGGAAQLRRSMATTDAVARPYVLSELGEHEGAALRGAHRIAGRRPAAVGVPGDCSHRRGRGTERD
jgi:hypothetical protein